MRIVISPRAEKELRKLSKLEQIIVAKKIRSLSERRGSQEKKLRGFANIFRLRLGNFRIVYRRAVEEIYIILIGHRKDIYRLLKRLF